MTNKSKITLGIISLIFSVLGGVSGASFAIGSGKQQILATLDQHEYRMDLAKEERRDYIEHIKQLEKALHDLKTEICVLQAIVTRVENKLP